MTRAPAWFVAAVAIAAIALVASVGVIWTSYGSESARDDRDELRAELIDVAERFFLESNTYDFTKIEDYKDRVHPLLTESNRKRFDDTLGKIVKEFARIEMTAQARLRWSAVEVLDDDSATVMVTGDVEARSTATPPSISHPRWEISLVLTDDGWRVEEHTELGDARVFLPREPAGRQ